ncbi:hypothetical protein JB92DRAFT_3133181 [Gautieria morchelliformis]|nr:hypothetical protein JB92DRAFT_3133181 [Gautieria morchelliformis]
MWVVLIHGVMIQPKASTRPKRKERVHFDDGPSWHKQGGALDEQTSETQWFEGSVGGTGRACVRQEHEGAPGAHQVPSQAGSTESDVLLDGMEEIASYDESMAAGWSQPEDTLAQTSGSPGSPTHRVKDELGAPRPMRGSEAGDHPMASVLASSPEVERYLEWVGERSLHDIPVGDGAHQNFWDILKKHQRVAVHLAHGLKIH